MKVNCHCYNCDSGDWCGSEDVGDVCETVGGLKINLTKWADALVSVTYSPHFFRINDVVRHKNYPNLEFTIQQINGALASAFLHCTNKTLYLSFWSPISELQFVDPFDFNLLPDGEVTKELCTQHEEGMTPISLLEKQSQVWYICKNCGAAMRPFNPSAKVDGKS